MKEQSMDAMFARTATANSHGQEAPDTRLSAARAFLTEKFPQLHLQPKFEPSALDQNVARHVEMRETNEALRSDNAFVAKFVGGIGKRHEDAPMLKADIFNFLGELLLLLFEMTIALIKVLIVIMVAALALTAILSLF